MCAWPRATSVDRWWFFSAVVEIYYEEIKVSDFNLIYRFIHLLHGKLDLHKRRQFGRAKHTLVGIGVGVAGSRAAAHDARLLRCLFRMQLR